MNWIKGPIAVGISYATYDNIRDLLRTVVVKYSTKAEHKPLYISKN